MLSWLIQTIVNVIQLIVSCLQNTFGSYTIVTLDTGTQVKVGREIAEGGFSIVFEAHSTDGKTYAIKRINCAGNEMVQLCRREAGVHRSVRHPHIMPLLGMSIVNAGSPSTSRHCYMLFPYVPHSLRAELNKRLLNDDTPPRPFPELTALQLFLHIIDGIQAMHDQKYTHRDIKLENILLQNPDMHQSHRTHTGTTIPKYCSTNHCTPVLIDFGSAGPPTQEIKTRRQVLEVIDFAAEHTTMPYRPPELLEGGCRAGDPVLDFTKVDVWSLGCTLFAILFGASPFESEFRRPSGKLRIIDCGALNILGRVPQPPIHSDAADWVSPPTMELIQWILTKDRLKRPTLEIVTQRVEARIRELGGQVRQKDKFSRGGGVGMLDQDSALENLLSSNHDFV